VSLLKSLASRTGGSRMNAAFAKAPPKAVAAPVKSRPVAAAKAPVAKGNGRSLVGRTQGALAVADSAEADWQEF